MLGRLEWRWGLLWVGTLSRLEGGLSSFSVPDDNPLAFFLRLPARVPRWVLAFNPLFDCLLSSSNSEWFKIWSPLIEFDTFLYRRISSLLYIMDVWDIHQIVRSELISVFAKFSICSSFTTQDIMTKSRSTRGCAAALGERYPIKM